MPRGKLSPEESQEYCNASRNKVFSYPPAREDFVENFLSLLRIIYNDVFAKIHALGHKRFHQTFLMSQDIRKFRPKSPYLPGHNYLSIENPYLLGQTFSANFLYVPGHKDFVAKHIFISKNVFAKTFIMSWDIRILRSKIPYVLGHKDFSTENSLCPGT